MNNYKMVIEDLYCLTDDGGGDEVTGQVDRGRISALALGGKMHWNIAAECISIINIIIIWFYSRKSNLVPSLKNWLFQLCFLVTFCAMVFNVLSTVMLAYPQHSPPFLTWLVTTVYFVATPLMGMAYFSYTVATVFEHSDSTLKIIAYTSFPGIVYFALVLLNPSFKILFDINEAGVYSQGPLIVLTYVIFYLYCLAAVVVVVIRKKYIEVSIRRILAAFPLIAMAVIIVQQAYPEVILSGSAATSAILIIYLYLQNKQNSIDYLTGLPNRQEFLKMLELQIKKSNDFNITVLSLRGFKRVNDTYGQHNGDLFLQMIGRYLENISEPHCLYRYGGDEFAIISYGPFDESIEANVKKLDQRMQQTWIIGENSCIIPAVIGVIGYPECADTVEELINGIEFAVSMAKSEGGTNVYYCGQEMLNAMRRRQQIVSILENNLQNNSFSVFYQPIISTESGRYIVAESLLRIPDSLIGPLYPNEFIPIAEETGMIIEITYQVLDKVCKFINRLTEWDPEFEGVHVNFSGQQFSQIGLAEKVEEIIRRNGTPFSKIKIEITESILAENADVVAEFAEEMQKKGVLIELDDFGTGYSNIVSVMNTPLDTVKLDKSLIWSAMERKEAAVMVKSLTTVFHEMGLQVLAEGVEDEEQAAFVKNCGMDLIQGFYFSRPLPEEEAYTFIKEQSSS